MIHLLKAEPLKLRKSLGFWILMAVSVTIPVIMFILMKTMSEAEGAKLTGLKAYYSGIADVQARGFLTSILAAIFICGEFSNRTFGLSLFSGFTRRKLMFSKIAVLFAGSLIINAVYPLVMCALFTLAFGFGGDFSAHFGTMARDMGLFLLGVTTMTSFCAFLAYLIRNVGGSIGTGFGGCIMLFLLAQIPVARIQAVTKFSFITQWSKINRADFNLSLYLGVMIVTLVILLTASAIVLEKSDLK